MQAGSAIVAVVVARIVLVVAAVAVGVCLTFSLRAVRLEVEAGNSLPPSPSPADIEHSERLLLRAEEHNPDIRPLAGRALLLSALGRPEAAAPLFREVLRREPDHLRAASRLYSDLRETQPAEAERLRRHLLTIAPPVDGG
jgi:cytochrome c-type biogenesis protein CcmH/NrfG